MQMVFTKKLPLLLCVICMIVSTGAWAQKEESLLIAFDTDMAIEAAGFEVEETIVSSYTKSARWTQEKNKGHREMKVPVADWTPYETLNLNMYAQENNGTQYNIFVYCGSSTFRGGYMRYVLTVDWEGWKQISIPLADFVPGEEEGFSWSGITGITINDFYQITQVEGSVACLDKIWLETEDTPQPEPDYLPPIEPMDAWDQEAGIATLVDFADAEQIPGNLTVDTQVRHLYGQSARWDTVALNDLRLALSKPADSTQYQYLNQWVYSQEATGAVINVALLPPGGFLYTTMTINWTGWKLVSLPLSNFTPGYEPDASNILQLEYASTGWEATPVPGTVLHLERIWLSETIPAAPKVSATVPQSGRSDLPILEPRVEIHYDDVLYPGQPLEKYISVTENGEPYTQYEIETKGSALKLHFTQKLEENAQYTVQVEKGMYGISGLVTSDPCELNFTTEQAELLCGEGIFEDGEGNVLNSMPEGGQLQVRFPIENNTDAAKTVTAVLALYDGEGKLCALERVSMEIASGSAESISISEEVQGAAAAMAYVCAEDGRPLRENLAALGMTTTGEHPGTGFVTELEDFSATVNMETLDISGKAAGCLNNTLLLRIEGEKGIIQLTPVILDAQGNFSMSYDLSALAIGSGMYHITLDGRSVAEKSEVTVYYADETERETFLTQVNGAADRAQMNQILQENMDTLLSSVLSEQDNVQHAANVLFEQKPFESALAVAEMIETAKQLLKQVNEADWAQLEQIFSSSSTILFYECDAYETFCEKSAADRAAIVIAVKKAGSFDSFEDLRQTLTTAVNAQEEEEPERPSTGAGGGGGGGGRTSGSGSTIIADAATVEKAKDTESIPEERAPFDDLEEAAWAKEYIMQLYQQGVISASEDRRFRPNDSVTRAEFTKMLIEALDLSKEDAVCSFTDVLLQDWYYPYMAAAQQLGLLTGYEDGSANANGFITRQDMAVVVYRAALLAGMEFSGEEGFTDEDQISAYGLEAVRTLKAAGILSGNEEGRFAPLDQLTRAQAAKVVCVLTQQKKQEG